MKFNESYDWFFFLLLRIRSPNMKIDCSSFHKQSMLYGSKRYQFTTANRSGSNHRLFIRCWAFCQSRGGSYPKHHIRRNVCLLRWPRKGGSRGIARGGEDEARGKLRQEPPLRFLQWLQTSATPAATRFFVYPLPSQFAPQRNVRACVHFPFPRQKRKDASRDAFLSDAVLDVSQSFRFISGSSVISCSLLRVPQLEIFELIYIDINIVQLKNM